MCQGGGRVDRGSCASIAGNTYPLQPPHGLEVPIAGAPEHAKRFGDLIAYGAESFSQLRKCSRNIGDAQQKQIDLVGTIKGADHRRIDPRVLPPDRRYIDGISSCRKGRQMSPQGFLQSRRKLRQFKAA